MKRYEFWFCHNLMYNEQTIKRIRWYNRWFIHIGYIVIDKVKGNAIFSGWDTPEIAFKEAKKEFERRGLYEHIMGKRI
nr:MAG: hypothetical protein [Bacteriophage sp.]